MDRRVPSPTAGHAAKRETRIRELARPLLPLSPIGEDLGADDPAVLDATPTCTLSPGQQGATDRGV